MLSKNILKYSPVLVFCYNRPSLLKKSIQSLIKNAGANETELFIFSDGPKTQSDQLIILELRKFLKEITGFKSITIIESELNKGLAKSIIDGVTKVLEEHNTVIVLEDDLLTSSNFLLFMNQALKELEKNPQVFSISGYSPPIPKNKQYQYDGYYFPRNSSHGWATWKNRWGEIDWSVSDFYSFINSKVKRSQFNKGGSDLSRMLLRQMNGKINSWSIRFCYHQYKTDTYTLYPIISKIQNIGFGPGATHTKDYNRFHTTLDSGSKGSFRLPENLILDNRIASEFRKFYSIRSRIFGRLKTYLFKAGVLKNK